MLAIEMPDGEVIFDADWHTMSDVMRGAHGQGLTRVTGKVIEITDLQTRPLQEERCEDYSWLYVSQCAHCQGHEADWEVPIKRRVYRD